MTEYGAGISLENYENTTWKLKAEANWSPGTRCNLHTA